MSLIYFMLNALTYKSWDPTTLHIICSVTNSICLIQILLLNRPCSVTNTKYNLTLFVDPCETHWALKFYNDEIIVTYQVIFHLDFYHPWEYLIIELLKYKFYQNLFQ